MALAPLFIQDMDTVKQRIRMTGVPADSDAQTMIEEAVRTVRVGFYRNIEASTLATLVGTSEVENPSTEAELLRQLASVTELKWIRYELMRTIPTMFFDSAPSSQTSWNEEGFVRGISTSEKDKELNRLWEEIAINLSLLEGETEIPNETSVTAFVVEAEVRPLLIGRTLFPQW